MRGKFEPQGLVQVERRVRGGGEDACGDGGDVWFVAATG